MNIREARQEIIDTVRVYLATDDTGLPLIPAEKQRPILLMGPPGIGKTAIMEQVAAKMNINLVSYTITHHTRQSAIGLPFIVKKTFGETDYSVTEYTMSEIIAEVYDRIEATGNDKGILFLDEINCVSETLTPTMLQFLQYKTFGTHKLPEGFVIVTAGNPPEVNASVRDFDIVTLDRVKRIDIDADFTAFRTYALNRMLHGAILAYLELRKDHFYSLRTDATGKHFVTARGWEDLSRMILSRERLSIPVNQKLIIQYLQDEEIAESFASYYSLWKKYKDLYHIRAILDGVFPAEKDCILIRQAPFDEKLSLVMLLSEAINQDCHTYTAEKETQEQLHEILVKAKDEADLLSYLTDFIRFSDEEATRQKKLHLLSDDEERKRKHLMQALHDLLHHSPFGEPADDEADAPSTSYISGSLSYEDIKNWFSLREDRRQERISSYNLHLTNAFVFLANVFGEGQEIVLFLASLNSSQDALLFINDCGNDAYYQYNKLLLLDERRQEILNETMKLGE